MNVVLPSIGETQNTEPVTYCDKTVTGKKGKSVTVTFTMCVEYFRAKPEGTITTLDFKQHFHVKPEASRQWLCRLERTGPVRRIAPGLYQYDPTKEHGRLRSVLLSGNWKFENVVLVTKGTRWGVLSRTEQTTEPGKDSECDIEISSIPTSGCVPKPEYPVEKLVTGQTVSWWVYPIKGTEIICISSKGAPPISPDHLLSILAGLESHGMDPAKWDLVCVEYLIDSEKIRFEGTHTYQAFKNQVFKGYNHGYYGRFEIADRSIIPATEFTDNVRIMVEGSLNTQAIREVNSLKKDVEEVKKGYRTLYNIVDKEREIRLEAKRGKKTAKITPTSPPPFRNGLEDKREHTTATGK